MINGEKIYAVLDHDPYVANMNESWSIISATGNHLLIVGKGRNYNDALKQFREKMPAGAVFRLTNLHLVNPDTRFFVMGEEHECALLLNDQIDNAIKWEKIKAEREYRDEKDKRDIIRELLMYDY